MSELHVVAKLQPLSREYQGRLARAFGRGKLQYHILENTKVFQEAYRLRKYVAAMKELILLSEGGIFPLKPINKFLDAELKVYSFLHSAQTDTVYAARKAIQAQIQKAGQLRGHPILSKIFTKD